jgi:hypothetical protein
MSIHVGEHLADRIPSLKVPSGVKVLTARPPEARSPPKRTHYRNVATILQAVFPKPRTMSSPTSPQSSATPVAVTVVVVERGGRTSEPYLGRPPVDDGCFVFGQHPLESAFVLDLRLRDRLTALVDGGHRITSAVLVWDELQPNRDIQRRAHLVARRLGPGGKVILTSKQQLTGANPRFEEFAEQLAIDLRWLGVELVVSRGEQGAPAPAPLTAAWNRLQRFRGFAEFEGDSMDREAAPSSPPASQERPLEPQAETREGLRTSSVFRRKQPAEGAVVARQVRGVARG